MRKSAFCICENKGADQRGIVIYTTNKGVNQPANTHSLIIVSATRCIDGIY